MRSQGDQDRQRFGGDGTVASDPGDQPIRPAANRCPHRAGRVRGRGIARRLAGRVGSSGRVVATDLDIRFIQEHGLGNLEARRHDILTDPLEQGAFDLAHARAVIMHSPDHQGALERMVAAVRPGGWVVVERIYRAAEAVLTPVVAGGTESWVRGSIQQLAARMEGTGLVGPDEVARFLALVADGSSRYAPPFLVTAWGQRPPV